MLLRRPAKLLRLHFSEDDRCNGAPLYEAVVHKCRSMGIAGATVFRGMEGYGEAAEIHRRRILAHDQPIVVTIVESAENIERLIPEIEKMLETNTVTTVWQRLRDEAGLEASITSFRRYVWMEFPDRVDAPRVTVLRPAVEPGSEALNEKLAEIFRTNWRKHRRIMTRSLALYGDAR